MTSKSFQYIQEVDEDENLVDCKSFCKKASNCLTKNKLISQIDSFSMEVKFLIKGEQEFKTLLSGFVGLLVYGIVGIIVFFIAWPDRLQSQISLVNYISNSKPTNADIFSYVNEPISFSVKKLGANPPPPQFKFNMYYIVSGKTPILLQWDTNCKYGDYCLTQNVNKNIDLKIYGGPTAISSSQFSLQIIWCDATNSSCDSTEFFQFILSFENTKKYKQKSLISYNQSYKFPLFAYGFSFVYSYTFVIDQHIYTSNNKFLGYLSNIYPQSFYLYNINSLPMITYETYPYSSNSNIPNGSKIIINAIFPYSKQIIQYNQQFVDLTIPLVFFFALIDPIRMLLNQFFLKRYNKNCRDLYVANKLFYVQDTQNDQKYNFQKGSAVLFTCLIHRHALTNIFQFMLTLCGKNLVDILPRKCIYTMYMINKGASVLCDNLFFGGLEELSTLEDSPPKKIYFDEDQLEQDEQNEDKTELQANYFANNPIQRVAFSKFCKDNSFFSAKRKNRVYQILLDTKYSTNLKDGLHKQFQTYVRNIQNMKTKGKFLQTMNDMNLPIQLVQQNDNRGEQSNYDLRVSKMPI